MRISQDLELKEIEIKQSKELNELQNKMKDQVFLFLRKYAFCVIIYYKYEL
jgi:hypothetical protein